MTYALERRGYVKAGPWTPECTVEHPEAGQLRKLMFGDRVGGEGNVLPIPSSFFSNHFLELMGSILNFENLRWLDLNPFLQLFFKLVKFFFSG